MRKPFSLFVHKKSMSTAVPSFTLAETLLVIVLMGVVASTLIPVVKASNQKSIEVAATVTNAKISEAMRLMKKDEKLDGYASADEFVDQFKNYIKIIDRCDSSNLGKCFHKSFKNEDGKSVSIDSVKTGAKLTSTNRENFNTNNVSIGLINGVKMVLNYQKGCAWQSPFGTASGLECLVGMYDVNGNKGPNKVGADIRFINGELDLTEVISKPVEPVRPSEPSEPVAPAVVLEPQAPILPLLAVVNPPTAVPVPTITEPPIVSAPLAVEPLVLAAAPTAPTAPTAPVAPKLNAVGPTEVPYAGHPGDEPTKDYLDPEPEYDCTKKDDPGPEPVEPEEPKEPTAPTCSIGTCPTEPTCVNCTCGAEPTAPRVTPNENPPAYPESTCTIKRPSSCAAGDNTCPMCPIEEGMLPLYSIAPTQAEMDTYYSDLATYNALLAEWDAYNTAHANWESQCATAASNQSAYETEHDAWVTQCSGLDESNAACDATNEQYASDHAAWATDHANWVTDHATWKDEYDEWYIAYWAYRGYLSCVSDYIDAHDAWEDRNLDYAIKHAEWEKDMAKYDAYQNYRSAKAAYDAAVAEYNTKRDAYNLAKDQYDIDKAAYDTAYEQYQTDLAAYNADCAARQAAYNAAVAKYNQKQAEYEQYLLDKAEYESVMAQYAEDSAEYQRLYTQYLIDKKAAEDAYAQATTEYNAALDKYNNEDLPAYEAYLVAKAAYQAELKKYTEETLPKYREDDEAYWAAYDEYLLALEAYNEANGITPEDEEEEPAEEQAAQEQGGGEG